MGLAEIKKKKKTGLPYGIDSSASAILTRNFILIN
jgi:hypothetical protein